MLSSSFIYLRILRSNSFSEEKNEAAQSGLMGRKNKKEKNSIKPGQNNDNVNFSEGKFLSRLLTFSQTTSENGP